MPDEPTWNLKDLLPNHKGEEFDALLDDIKSKVSVFEQKRSWLEPSISSEKFNSLLKELEQIDTILSRISAFGHLWFAEDSTNDDARAFVAKIEQISTELENKLLFFSLWWKDFDDGNSKRLMSTSGLNRYFLEHMRKLKTFVLSEKEEKIINLKDSTGSNTLSKVYDIISASLRFPLIVDGKRQQLTSSELKVHFTSPKANMREGAYKSLFKVYKKQRDVLGELYCSIVRDWHNESIKLRKYPSHISVRNKANDIPDE
ncbi:oligoendopeptidase F, partial [Candidatus Woesearchaeota archaeon]|nr:oligoendopeptidase F [Candidatus Woesearchaeota archaeon]